jgi:Domain of unknown function (DUF4148)
VTQQDLPAEPKEPVMNKLSTVIATTTLLIAAGAASAQTTPLTREQVIADLVAARNSGELAAIQGEKGVEVATPGARQVANSKLPRQAVLTVKPTELQLDNKTAAALAADHGENAAREMGEFVAPTVRRAPALASR